MQCQLYKFAAQKSGLMRVLLFAFVLVMASIPYAPVGAVPAMWRVQSDVSTIYLFGTFHLLGAGVKWRSDTFQDTVEGADTITLEVTMEQSSPALVAWIVQQKGLYPPRDSLQRRLEPALWQDVQRVGTSLGVPVEDLDRMRPWYVATLLATQSAAANGFLPEHGVESWLEEHAQSRGILPRGLEMAHEQISSLADQPDEVQIELLQQTVADIHNLSALYEHMITAWMAGDEAEMTSVFLDDLKTFPSVYERLFIRRNQNWIPKLITKLSEPGVHFVAVGAAHLVGEDSVIAMLRARGHTVERSQ